MNEWLAPMIGFLIFLFFCPGVFVWVWLHNRRFNSYREELAVDTSSGNRLGARWLTPVTAGLALIVLLVGYGFTRAAGADPAAGRPIRRAGSTVNSDNALGTFKRKEGPAGEHRDPVLKHTMDETGGGGRTLYDP